MPDTKYFINKMFHKVDTDYQVKKDYLETEGDYVKGIKKVLFTKFQTLL